MVKSQKKLVGRTSLLQSGLCYTLFRKNKVITFAHGRELQLQSKIQIYSASKVPQTSKAPDLVRVAEINTQLNFVILVAEADISEDSPSLRFSLIDKEFFQAAMISTSSTASFHEGVITSVTHQYCLGSLNEKLDGLWLFRLHEEHCTWNFSWL